MCIGSDQEMCCKPTTTWRQQSHSTGGSIQKLKMVYNQWHRDHQGALRVSQDSRSTSQFQTHQGQCALNTSRRRHGIAPVKRNKMTQLDSWGVVQRCYASLPTHVCTYLHRRSGDVNVPTWGLCTHPNRSQGITPSFPEAGTLIGLYWGHVRGLAQDWCGISVQIRALQPTLVSQPILGDVIHISPASIAVEDPLKPVGQAGIHRSYKSAHGKGRTCRFFVSLGKNPQI